MLPQSCDSVPPAPGCTLKWHCYDHKVHLKAFAIHKFLNLFVNARCAELILPLAEHQVLLIAIQALLQSHRNFHLTA